MQCKNLRFTESSGDEGCVEKEFKSQQKNRYQNKNHLDGGR